MKHETNEQKAEMNRLGTFLAGAIFGGLAGAVAMLLMAEQSGKKTRAQIQLKGEELRDQASEVVEDVVSQTRDTARKITSDIRTKAKEIKTGGEHLLAEQKARLNNTVADVKAA